MVVFLYITTRIAGHVIGHVFNPSPQYLLCYARGCDVMPTQPSRGNYMCVLVKNESTLGWDENVVKRRLKGGGEFGCAKIYCDFFRGKKGLIFIISFNCLSIVPSEFHRSCSVCEDHGQYVIRSFFFRARGLDLRLRPPELPLPDSLPQLRASAGHSPASPAPPPCLQGNSAC